MNKPILLTAALLLTTALFAQDTPAKPAAPKDELAEKVDTTPPGLPVIHPIEHKNIVYRTANGKDQVLDVYEQPGNKPAPVIIYWHGGAWRRGERPHSWGSFRPLLNMGFSIVAVDYRLAIGEKTPGPVVDPAPAQVEDIRCSMAWVGKNAAQYHFDTKRIVAYGTSAGGHLALMAGFLPAKNGIDIPACGPVPHVAAVMDFYGIPDVTKVVTTGIPLSKSTLIWLGGKPATDPDALKLAAAMSPVTYLRKGLPPVFIAHGDADPTVPYTQSTDLKTSLEKLNIPVEMYTVPGGGHGQWNSEQMAKIWVDLLAFFRAQNILPPA
jgi:acetyl esterase/lipase